MIITISDKYPVEFRLFPEENTWEGKTIVNGQEITFSFSADLVPVSQNNEPDRQAVTKFLEFFFKHFETIFEKSKKLLIAFLKEFGNYDEFVSIDEEEMHLGCIEIISFWNHQFELNFVLESDIYYTYQIDFYELSQLLVLIGIRRVGNEVK